MLQKTGHVIIVGATTTALRLCEELIKAGERVYVLVRGGYEQWIVADLAKMGATVETAVIVREPEMRTANVCHARAVVVLGQEDTVAVRIALIVEELAPQVPLVLEMSNSDFGKELEPILGHCQTLSSADLAAPAFVSACLAGGGVESFEIAGKSVTAGSRDRVGGDILTVLGDSSDQSLMHTDQGDVVVGTKVIGKERASASQIGLWGAIPRDIIPRLRWLLIAAVGLMLASLGYFFSIPTAGDSLTNRVWTRIYLALTTSTLTNISDLNNLNWGQRFGGIVVQILAVVLSACITAVIVDALIGVRITELAGGVRGKPKRHIVVCGLGRVGKEVALHLAARGLAVVAIDRDENCSGVLAARRAKIPVVIAAANDKTAHEQAGIARADCVVVVTDDDAVNLETALIAKHVNPDIRVVTRLFDHELADRVERRLGLGPTRSVSMLAAPAFAAAVLGRRREMIIPVGRRVVIFTELTVQPDSAAAHGIELSQISSVEGVLVLAVQLQGQDWQWQPEASTLIPGDKIAVAASRMGLATVFKLIKRPSMWVTEFAEETS